MAGNAGWTTVVSRVSGGVARESQGRSEPKILVPINQQINMVDRSRAKPYHGFIVVG